MTRFILLTAICSFSLGIATLQAQTPYLNYLYNSSPSLTASRQLAQQVDGWFQDMDRAVVEYKRKNPNGNPEAEARGRAYLSGIQQAYQIQEDASYERRKAELRRRYTDTYNNARAWRNYYQSYGYYYEAEKMQQVMNAYNPKQFK
ncbi:MAG: hypothetical protein AAF587_15595 [Bacteroidota bacterium]